MTLKSRITLYLVAMHALLAAAAVLVLVDRIILLFVVEALFLISVAVSIRLVRAIFVPLELVRTGAELIEERDFTSRFVPIGQPEMDRLIEIYNRMIDRLREERLAAEERHRLLEHIIEASSSGIVICDFEGAFELMNPAAQRLMNADLERELRALGAGEARLVAHTGPRRLKIGRSQFRDRGFLKSFYVIEELTEELRLSEKSAYEKLVRIMTHEVNNSVGAVRSLLESSLAYAPQVSEKDRDDFRSALEVASARIDALNRFMSAFADVVRIPPPRRESVVVAELVERVAALLRPELGDRGIAIDLGIEDRSRYEVDASQIEQVILNVLRNAIDAVSRDGEIEVAFRDGELSVADSGPGVPSEVRNELFTPFFTTKRDGRGLGLTVVQEILSNHGIPFALENGEKGAVFTMRLGE
jgi:nitrogen fixation/metabolism regulation signal transduction histidine kinase